MYGNYKREEREKEKEKKELVIVICMSLLRFITLLLLLVLFQLVLFICAKPRPKTEFINTRWRKSCHPLYSSLKFPEVHAPILEGYYSLPLLQESESRNIKKRF